MQENSILARIAAPIFMNAVGKSPDYGARIYLTGALAEPKDHVSYQKAPQEGAGSRGLDHWYEVATASPLADVFYQ